MTEIVLSPEGEHLAREFAGHFQALYERLGEAETRVGQIERLLSLRLNTKLMAVTGDARDAAELLAGIREGVQIESVLLDLGQRLGHLEYNAYLAEANKAAPDGEAESGAEEPPTPE